MRHKESRTGILRGLVKMKRVYDCLAQHGFSKPGDAHRVAAKLNREDVGRLFEDYQETVSSIPVAARQRAGSIGIFPDSWAKPLPTNMIRQLALYANVIYVHDPILECLDDWKGLDISPKYVIPYPDKDHRVRSFLHEFSETIKEILKIKPLATAGIIRFVPSQLFGPRREPGALYTTSFYGPEITGRELMGDEDPMKRLPDPIIQYASDNLHVYPVELVEGHHRIQYGAQLSPGRMIAVLFPGDPRQKVFNLFETRVKNGESLKVEMSLDLHGGGEPVDPKTFSNWVQGSRDDVLLERLDTLQRDLYLAAFSRARFLTNLPTSRDLAGLNLKDPNDGTDAVVSALLRVRLPYFDGVSNDQLAKARRNEAAFEEFRTALDKAFRAVEGCSETGLQARADEVVRDVLLAPVARIEARMKALRRNLFLDALMLAGTLGATIITQGNTLTTAAALLVARRTLSDYKSQKSQQDRIRESAGFLYWEATKHSRKQGKDG
jgi:hypothetical protein